MLQRSIKTYYHIDHLSKSIGSGWKADIERRSNFESSFGYNEQKTLFYQILLHTTVAKKKSWEQSKVKKRGGGGKKGRRDSTVPLCQSQPFSKGSSLGHGMRELLQSGGGGIVACGAAQERRCCLRSSATPLWDDKFHASFGQLSNTLEAFENYLFCLNNKQMARVLPVLQPTWWIISI